MIVGGAMRLKLLVSIAGCLFFFGCPQETQQTGQNPNAQQPAQPATSQPAQPTNTAVQQPATTQPATTTGQTGQPATAAGGTDEGKKLYMTGCANCHGPDGTGAMMRAMLPKIGDLTSAEMHARMKDEDIAALIANGREKMPPFGGVFKPEQIQAIVAYVRTMKKT